MLAQALVWRNNRFNRTFADWNVFFGPNNDARPNGGREDLMDLWNNEIGSIDGVASGVFSTAIGMFNARRNRGDIVLAPTAAQLPQARAQHVWSNKWYRPVR
jgi:hypothetical protein